MSNIGNRNDRDDPAVRSFGVLRNGEPVSRAVIGTDLVTASIISRGAAVQDLRISGVDHPLVLGFPTLDGYAENSSCFGATVGRYANRISKGQVRIDGRLIHLDRNEHGRQTLHGGRDGSAQRNWRIVDHERTHVSLADRLPDGHMGFPGTLDVTLTYRIVPPMVLELEFHAVTTAATPCSFAHHSYFNLDGSKTILNHELRIDAEHYLELDADKIPTGVVAPVESTPLDFRTFRPLAKDGIPFPHDHNFCLSGDQCPIRPVAVLRGPGSGLEMEIETTEPGLQLCHGAMTSTRNPGLGGSPYGPNAGVALEPQCWPDSPNRSGFPSAILVPGRAYRQMTRFRFSRFGSPV